MPLTAFFMSKVTPLPRWREFFPQWIRTSRRPLFRAVPPRQKARMGLALHGTIFGSLIIWKKRASSYEEVMGVSQVRGAGRWCV